MPRTANDDPDRSRILLREFKKRRQPKRCDSLPCFQAVPGTRQLYLCHRCRFTNTICKICPWCLSPCDVAAQVAVSLVRRRLSSPMLLSDAQKMQLAKIERATNPPPTVAALLPTAARSSPSPARGGVALSHEAGTSSTTIPPRSTRRLPGASADAEADDLRRRHRNAALYSATDVVATMTEDSTLQPFLDQIAAACSEGRAITTPEPLIATPPHSVRTSWDALSPMSRTSRPRTPGPPSSPGPRGRMLNGDGPIMYPSERPPSKLSAPLSPTSHSSTPCLRHKRRMPALRQRSSCHLRRRSTSSVSSCRRETGNFSSPASSPRPKTATTATSPPGSPQPKTVRSIRFGSPSPGPSPGPVLDEIPLGHPQRPLYTAIRKNMSRPESPTPSAAASASFDFHVYERGTRSLDIDDAPPALRYGSLARASQLAIAYNTAAARPALFGTATGFSVSGETEMRMDLARSRSMDGVPGDFAFREGKRGRQEGASTSVKARVKSLGKTLKGLLRVKN
ncbi:hypothetical protein GSI_02354 [Ganoderma sinense ZZ0214-1]|uniref:Uncharacterized protein n=1 Tax=Ganoderma sinense ZZ0214-1 TaxID=1077348 RepID=A0A2G8SPD1_9APHY|nr:hypothetical protein GSI_02354 [Ganoderma sinense ZZ0214-1]